LISRRASAQFVDLLVKGGAKEDHWGGVKVGQ
jgi:hypothetical protein